MNREYWIVLIVYIGMQLSSLLGIPGDDFSIWIFRDGPNIGGSLLVNI